MELNAEKVLLILCIVTIGAYLVHPDHATETVMTLAVGGLLTVSKQVADKALGIVKAVTKSKKAANGDGAKGAL